MAKKPLGAPLAPAGPQYAFFSKMQSLVLEYGDPSLADMATRIHVSRQVLHRALRGPDLPSRDLVARVVDLLTLDDEKHRDDVKRDALRHWTEAVWDRRQKARPSAQTTLGTTAVTSEQDRLEASRDRQAFGASLRRLHQQADAPTLRQIGIRIGLPRSTLSDWLNGRSIPRDRTLVQGLVDTLFQLSSRAHTGDLVPLRDEIFDAWDKYQASAAR